VLIDDFKDHLGAEIQNAIPTEAWEIFAQALCERVVQRL
jgi:hypothetical protein